MIPYAIGIDLGGTNIKALAIDDAGTVLAETVLATGEMRSGRSG